MPTNFMFSQLTMCPGCPKDPEWIATGFKCPVYADPSKTFFARIRAFCPFNPPDLESAKKKKVNPLKASKRGGR